MNTILSSPPLDRVFENEVVPVAAVVPVAGVAVVPVAGVAGVAVVPVADAVTVAGVAVVLQNPVVFPVAQPEVDMITTAAATADPAAATADLAAPDRWLALRVLQDVPKQNLTIEGVVWVDPKQLKTSLPSMKTYFGLLRRLSQMAPSASQMAPSASHMDAANVAEFKSALEQLEAIGRMPFRDFWEPWFATPHRIKVLESRLAIALLAVEDKPEYYGEAPGKFNQLVSAYAITGTRDRKDYQYPSYEWLQRHAKLESFCVSPETTTANYTPGMISIRTSKLLSSEGFLSEVTARKAQGIFDDLCPGVTVATLSRGCDPESNATYYKPAVAPRVRTSRTAGRIMILRGFGPISFDYGSLTDCIKNYPKVMRMQVGANTVRYLDIPNEAYYKQSVIDVLKGIWWGHGLSASMIPVPPRPEPTKAMYNQRIMRVVAAAAAAQPAK